MTEVQKQAYSILLEINRICEASGLRYYIYAGTLLGAVRHKGFIPWDDDIDIVMLREDYERFPEACQKYLNNDEFELQTIRTDLYANNPWMKLHKKNTAFISGVRRKEAMEGINIDIFPVDNAPDDPRLLRKTARYIDRTNFIYKWRFAKRDKHASRKMKLFRFAIDLIPPLNEARYKEKFDKKVQRFNGEQTKNVVYLSNRAYKRKVIDRSVFDGVEMLRFEDREFPAPKGWERVLTGLYGPDYMKLPPVEDRVTVHGTQAVNTNISWRVIKAEDEKV